MGMYKTSIKTDRWQSIAWWSLCHHRLCRCRVDSSRRDHPPKPPWRSSRFVPCRIHDEANVLCFTNYSSKKSYQFYMVTYDIKMGQDLLGAQYFRIKREKNPRKSVMHSKLLVNLFLHFFTLRKEIVLSLPE